MAALTCTKLNADDKLRIKTKLNQIGVLHLFNKRWDLRHKNLLKELLVEDKSWCKGFTYRGHISNWTDEVWAKTFSFNDLSGCDTLCYSLTPQHHKVTDEEVRKHVSLKGNKVYSGWRPESIEDPDFRFFVMAYQFLFAYHTRRNLVNSHLLMFLDYAWKGNTVDWANLVQKHVKKEVKLYIKSKGERKNESNIAPFLYYLYEHFGEITVEEREQVLLPPPLNDFQSEKGEDRTEGEKLVVDKKPDIIKAELIELPSEDLIEKKPGKKRKRSEEFDAVASSLQQNQERITKNRAGDDLIPTDQRVDQSDVGNKQKVVDRAGRPSQKGELLKLMADLVREARTKREELKLAGNPSHAEPTAILDTSNAPPLLLVDSVASDPKLRPVYDNGLETRGSHENAPAVTYITVKESAEVVKIPNKDEQNENLTFDELHSMLSPTDEVVKLVEITSLSTGLNARSRAEVMENDVQHFGRASKGLISEDAHADGSHQRKGVVSTCTLTQEYVYSKNPPAIVIENPLGSSSQSVFGDSCRPSSAYVDKALQCDIVSDVDHKWMHIEPNRPRGEFKATQGSSSASCDHEANCQLPEQVDIDVVGDSDQKLSPSVLYLEPSGDKHLGLMQIARKDGPKVDNTIGAASDFKTPPAQKQILSPNCAENITKGEANQDSQEIQAREGRNLFSMGSVDKEMSLPSFLEKFEEFWFEEIRPLITFLESKMSRDVIHSSEPGKYVRLVSDCFVRLKLKENECQQLLEVLEKHLKGEGRNTFLSKSHTITQKMTMEPSP